MKMSNYTISIEVGNRQTRTENIKGYIYKKDGLIFGIDHRYKDHWQITEINTGRSIGCGIPRLKDADTVLTDEMVEKVKHALKNMSKTLFINNIEDYERL